MTLKRPGLVWFLAFVAVSALYVRQLFTPHQSPQIIFDRKKFFESGDEYVYMAGTLTGDGLGYPNNSVAVWCYKDRMECQTYSIEEIGPNQIGRLDTPASYPVIKWSAFEIVASGPADAVDCRKLTINIERKSETSVWVEEPINQASAACKSADSRVLKWTIEDSRFWRDIK